MTNSNTKYEITLEKAEETYNNLTAFIEKLIQDDISENGKLTIKTQIKLKTFREMQANTKKKIEELKNA